MLMDILAGVVCGLVMGTVLLGAGIYALFSSRDIYEKLAGRLPRGASPTVFMLSLLIAVPPLCGVFGALAGALYNLATRSFPEAGLGSPNFAFTVVVLGLTALVTAVVTLLVVLGRRSIVRLWLVIAVAFAGIFGWLLPLVATWR